MIDSPPLIARDFYSPAEVKQRLGISHATFYRLAAAGKLRLFKVGRRTLVPAECLRDCMVPVDRGEKTWTERIGPDGRPYHEVD